jgi:hypothetical protein
MRYLARPTSRAQEPGECVCESGLSSSPPSSLPRRLWRALCLCVWLTGAHRRAASWSRWRRRHRAARRLSANAKSDAPARDCRGRDWLHLDHFMTNLINHSPALFSVVSTRTVSHYRPSLRFHRVISEALTHGVVEEWGREKSASCLPSRPWDSKHLTQHHIGGCLPYYITECTRRQWPAIVGDQRLQTIYRRCRVAPTGMDCEE